MEYSVAVLVRRSSDISNLLDLEKVEIFQANPEVWGSLIETYRPDVLIINHWEGVGNRFRDDKGQFENVSRISSLVSSAQIAGVRTIIGVGSQAELGPINSVILESAVDNPTSNYGKAKVETRNSIRRLIDSQKTRFVWMRIFSTYGPLDEGSWLIPNIVDSLAKNLKFQLTKGEQEWSYLHAFDLVKAFSTVINTSDIQGIVNVGNPVSLSIREAANMVGDLLQKTYLLDFGALEYRSDQVMKLLPICETLTKAGWHPEISFDEGIKQTVSWLERKSLQPLITKSGRALNITLPARKETS